MPDHADVPRADVPHAPDAVASFPPALRVSVLLVGDELLDGWVADRNGHWLAGRLSTWGIPLDRIQVVPDDHDAIDEALSLELARTRPRVVITSGGIGTTPDDLTMAAVARHLGRQLVAHPEIAERIDDVIRRSAVDGHRIDDEQADIIRRMALAPDGSRVLRGSTGMVPGVVVDLDGGVPAPQGAAVVILPGVPQQFRAIIEEAVEPELLRGRGRPRRVAEFSHRHPESAFTSALEDIGRRFPGLTVGSYPQDECIIRLKGGEEDVEGALAVLRQRAEALERYPGAVGRREAWRRRSPAG